VARTPQHDVEYPERLRELVEAYLDGLDFGGDARVGRLAEAMRYSLLAGGKRIRPVLTLAVAESREQSPREVLPTAAALELIHTYSLIHDDLPAIDDDDLRRGKPTCHVAYGEDIAILAGDGLFAEAYALILERQQGEPGAVLMALREVARATGVRGMVAGQYMDVTSVAGGSDDLRRLHTLKTGRLIEAAVTCGAALTGARLDRELAPYREFAGELGLLFQIVDDILDVEGDESALGKTVGKDEDQDKLTYVSKYGLDRAVALAGESYSRALELLAGLPGDTGALDGITGYVFARGH
jgi:geranylgeranyl diphosphate synthase, type II